MANSAVVIAVLLAVLAMAVPSECDYPKIASQWGMVLSAKNSPSARDYDECARYGMIVAAGGTVEQWRTARKELDLRKSHVIILMTQTLTNVHGSPAWMHDDWYLKRPDGSQVKYWDNQIRIPNILINECLDAVVAEAERGSKQLLQEKLINGIFFDSILPQITYFGEVDTDGDGKADKPSDIDPAWQARQVRIFNELRKRFPNVLIMINGGGPTYGRAINGQLIEGQCLLDTVADGALSAQKAIETLCDLSASAEPNVTFALTCSRLGMQAWRQGRGSSANTAGEVELVRRDYKRMRLGLCTTLMTDAYFGYDWGTSYYGYRFWYPEYDAPLGDPLGPAKQIGDYYSREFEDGTVFLNPTKHPITVALKQPMRRLKDTAAPKHELQFDDHSDAFSATGSWSAKSGEAHYVGHSYQATAKPDQQARWTFTAPSTDTYTVYANAPGGDGLTSAATYSLSGLPNSPNVTLDQRKCDGGWVKLFDASLETGKTYSLVVMSGENGETAADAVRIESRARLNDGSLINSVTIDPLDGTILLREKPGKNSDP